MPQLCRNYAAIMPQLCFRLGVDEVSQIMKHLNPRDVARSGGVNRTFREASHTEFHNILNNPVLTKVAERYKQSKLQTPFVQVLGVENPIRGPPGN